MRPVQWVARAGAGDGIAGVVETSASTKPVEFVAEADVPRRHPKRNPQDLHRAEDDCYALRPPTWPAPPTYWCWLRAEAFTWI